MSQKIDRICSVWKPWSLATWPNYISIKDQFNAIIEKSVRETLWRLPHMSQAGLSCQRQNHYNL